MGLGQVGGREGGPSGRLAHLALLGWAPLRLQAGAAAAGARYQMKLSSHCSRGGREDGEGATGVSLTPVVSQTNCSLWKHASKCFGLVSNRVLDATHSAAHRSVSSPDLLVAPLPDILMTLILFFFF